MICCFCHCLLYQRNVRILKYGIISLDFICSRGENNSRYNTINLHRLWVTSIFFTFSRRRQLIWLISRITKFFLAGQAHLILKKGSFLRSQIAWKYDIWTMRLINTRNFGTIKDEWFACLAPWSFSNILKNFGSFWKTFSLKYSSLVRKRKEELFRSFQSKKCFIAIQIFLQSVEISLCTFRSFFVGDITLCS